jgi:hypothetical protein
MNGAGSADRIKTVKNQGQDVREAAEWIQKLLTEILLRYSAGDHSGFDDGSPFDR